MSALASGATRHSTRVDLLSEVLRLRGIACIRVLGSSMLPSVLPEDILVLESYTGTRPIIGDVIVFARWSRLFAHRIVGAYEKNRTMWYVTRGDSLPEPDPLVPSEEVLARVSRIIRRGRLIDPRTTPWRKLGSLALRNSDFLKACLLWLLCRRNQVKEALECPA